MTHRIIPLLTALIVAACSAKAPEPERTHIPVETSRGTAPGTCWSKHLADSVPGPAPEKHTSETAQTGSTAPRIKWFETPCAADLDPDFAASLQRALKARGLYSGAITGRMDEATRAAIRRYQQPHGLDSGTLSLAAARRLGLVAVELPGG